MNYVVLYVIMLLHYLISVASYPEETHFNPKFRAFDENNPYAQNMYR